MIILAISLIIATYAGLYRVFEKADIAGWKALIPIYNILLLLWIIGKPDWWLFFLVIPLINIAAKVLINIKMAKCFGKDLLFGIGLALMPFVFYPILGFGRAQYHRPTNP